jgi:hypothetical protein
MLENSNIIMDEELIITFCTERINETKNKAKEITSNDICIKMQDYLMF